MKKFKIKLKTQTNNPPASPQIRSFIIIFQDFTLIYS